MALQYDEPTSTSDVMSALQENGTLSPETLNALIRLLGLNNPGAVDVGFYDLASLAAALGPVPDLALIDVGGATGQPLNAIISPTLLAAVQGYIFQGQADLQVNFNTIERAIAMSDGNDTVNVAGDKNTTLSGGGGNDTLLTSGGNDVVNGGVGNDVINTGGGNDLVISINGNDVVDAGSGYDTVVVNGALNSTIIGKSGTTLVLTGSTSGTTTTMMNTEFVQLSSGTIAVVGTEREAMALRLYQTLLDRSADSGGAQYWANLVRQGNAGVADIANGFINSAEFQAAHGGISTEAFIRLLYQFGLNRDAEAGGLNFWLSTGLQRADLAVQIVGSAEAGTTITDVQLLPGTI